MRFVDPDLSPDGRWLAYAFGTIGSNLDIYVSPFPPTGNRFRITQNQGFAPVWSRPDGDELFYHSDAGGSEVLLRSVTVATNRAFTFTEEQTVPVEGYVTGLRSPR